MKPSIKKNLLGYEFQWPDDKIKIIIKRLKMSRNDDLHCEIIVKTWLPGFNPHLHQSNFNMNSTKGKIELINILSKRCEEPNWESIIEQLRVYTLENYRTGEPIRIFSGNEEYQAPVFLLYPFVQEKQLTMIYGEGGIGKSTFALMLSAALQEKCELPHTNLKKPSKGVLYLDYETDEATLSWQYKRILNGLGLNGLPLRYRRCTIPLLSDAEKIKELIVESNVDTIVVDSAGAACGSDMNDAMSANQIALILRSFETTNILISHTSKSNGPKKTPYGSVYFINNARSLWEIRKSNENREDEVSIGIFHRKANIMQLQKPKGYRFVFHDELIEVLGCDPKEMDGFSEEFTISQRILDTLKSFGLMTTQELIDELGVSEGSVKGTIHRMKKEKRVIKVEDKWGAKDKIYK